MHTLMPYLDARLGYLSVSIFTTLTFPFISSAIPCARMRGSKHALRPLRRIFRLLHMPWQDSPACLHCQMSLLMHQESSP